MKVKICKGQQKDLTIKLRRSNCDGGTDPYDLTGLLAIARVYLNGVLTNLSCVISGDPVLGVVVLSLSDEQTLLLYEGDLEIDIYVGTYAAPPVINPPVDVTNEIFKVRNLFEVVEVLT